MEMRKEHRKLQLAIVVVLDRSGSMSAPAGGGKKKIDLANIGTVQVLDLLGPTDELGVIAVDSRPHTVVELAPVDSVRGQRSRILGIESMGGGIFIYEGLAAGSQMLMKAKAETKHLILFADAADSEEPGRYVDLLAKTREAGITVSVIGMGTEADVDANLLKDIAARGGGQIYFSNTPEEFPRIFAQDTFTVARSTFVEDSTPVKVTGGFSTLGGQGDWQPPAIGGYNLTYLKPEANVALVTQDEYAAPVVAAWQAGSGRVLAFTGEADGKHAGDLARWPSVGDFHATLARWTAGEQPTLPDNMLLTQEVRDGACLVQLHLDPERTNEPFATPPRVRVLHGLPGNPPAKLTVPMLWKSADLLESVVAIRGRETALNTVEIPGLSPIALPPVCLMYSPEFAPEPAGRGRITLEKLSATTSGEARVDLPGIWKGLPSKPQFVDLAVWLVILALLVYLLEIFERRTGWLGASRRRADESLTESVESQRLPTSSPAKKKPSALDLIVWRRTQKPRVAVPTRVP
ncbi:MAG: VWA domain-containing protein, partial [Verrucomicrobia bacterium]|nr:VWA domain-containing protein [Verrucomicrobiota bacterium]